MWVFFLLFSHHVTMFYITFNAQIVSPAIISIYPCIKAMTLKSESLFPIRATRARKVKCHRWSASRHTDFPLISLFYNLHSRKEPVKILKPFLPYCVSAVWLRMDRLGLQIWNNQHSSKKVSVSILNHWNFTDVRRPLVEKGTKGKNKGCGR